VSGCVIWLTGLPGSGKSTLAGAIRERLGDIACILDGDEVRDALVPRPGYTDEERDAFYASLANLAALVARQGLIALVPATAHRAAFRDRARAAAPAFIEVHVATAANECAARDPKGLWARAAGGDVQALPGSGVSYEPPAAADVIATGGFDRAAIDAIVDLVDLGR
jgi:adenylylsulfate kinase